MNGFWTTVIATFMFASIDLIRRLRGDLQTRPGTTSLAISAAIYAGVWAFFIRGNTQSLVLALSYGLLGGLLYFAIMILVFRLRHKIKLRKQL